MDYFTSDLHFCHDRDFIYKQRGFESVSDMDKTIIKNFTEILTDDDDLYILGDSFLNDNEKGIECLKQLPGRKHFIWGNHDTDKRIELVNNEISNIDNSFCQRYKYGNFRFLLTHYPTLTGNFDEKIIWNLSGHTHSKEKFEFNGKAIYNVAVDAHNCCHVSIEQIIQDIKEHRQNNG